MVIIWIIQYSPARQKTLRCKNFDLKNFDFATIQLTKAGSKLAMKILKFVLAKALPFTFHTNANGPDMQKEKIIVWHVFRFQEK